MKTIILFLFLIGSLAQAKTSCEGLFFRYLRGSQGLEQLGFSKHVAKKIAKDLPEVAEKILSLPPQDARAVVVYRGLNKPPKDIAFDTEYFDKSDFWFSLDPEVALSFASSKDRGTILEVEVPAYYFRSSYDPRVRDPEKLLEMGFSDGTISRYQIINVKPYLRRLGLVDGRKNPGSIQWRKP